MILLKLEPVIGTTHVEEIKDLLWSRFLWAIVSLFCARAFLAIRQRVLCRRRIVQLCLELLFASGYHVAYLRFALVAVGELVFFIERQS